MLLKQINKYSEKFLRHEDLRGAPVLILVNKQVNENNNNNSKIDSIASERYLDSLFQDISGASSSDEVARYLDLKELNDRIYMFVAISAHEG